MLWERIKRNVDIVVFTSAIILIYSAGWEAQVLGFLQRGILITGLFDAKESEPSKQLSDNFELNLIDSSGNLIDSKELQNKTLFINIWASWCPPCLAEMPVINNFYKQVRDEKNIVVLMISVDRNPQKANRYLIKKSFSFPVYFLAKDLPDELSYQSIPTTYVISPSSEVMYHHEGMANYDNPEFITFVKSL